MLQLSSPRRRYPPGLSVAIASKLVSFSLSVERKAALPSDRTQRRCCHGALQHCCSHPMPAPSSSSSPPSLSVENHGGFSAVAGIHSRRCSDPLGAMPPSLSIVVADHSALPLLSGRCSAASVSPFSSLFGQGTPPPVSASHPLPFHSLLSLFLSNSISLNFDSLCTLSFSIV